jgi:hypothetical protein
VTLRLKLFVLIGGLLALMVGAEWILIDTLTKDLRVEVTAVATSVGKDIVRILHPIDEKPPGLPAPAPDVRKVVVDDEAHVGGDAARVLTLPGGKDVGVDTRSGVASPGGKPGERHVERYVVTTLRMGDEGTTTSSTKSWTTAGGTGFLFLEGPAARTRIAIQRDTARTTPSRGRRSSSSTTGPS